MSGCSRPICLVTYRDEKTVLATAVDREQAETIVGIISQDYATRTQCAKQLAACLDDLQRRFPGNLWQSQGIQVALKSKNGVYTGTRPPIPGRAAALTFYLCMTPGKLEDVTAQLSRFVAGEPIRTIAAGPMTTPKMLFRGN